MSRARIERAPRWMQRVGHEEERLGEPGRLRRQHRCLASPIRLPAEEQAPRLHVPENLYGGSQTFPIASRAGRVRWTRPPRLPVWKIASKDEEAPRCERRREGDQQGHRAVASGAVSEHEPAERGGRGPMQESTHRRNTGRGAMKRLGVGEAGHPRV